MNQIKHFGEQANKASVNNASASFLDLLGENERDGLSRYSLAGFVTGSSDVKKAVRLIRPFKICNSGFFDILALDRNIEDQNNSDLFRGIECERLSVTENSAGSNTLKNNLDKSLEQLKALSDADLSDGSKAVRASAVQDAKIFLEVFWNNASASTSFPRISKEFDGEVGLFWRVQEFLLDVELLGDGLYSYASVHDGQIFRSKDGLKLQSLIPSDFYEMLSGPG